MHPKLRNTETGAGHVIFVFSRVVGAVVNSEP